MRLAVPWPVDLTRTFAALPREGRVWLDGDAAHPEGGVSYLAAEPVERVAVPFGALAPARAFDRLGPPPDPDTGGGLPHWIGYIAYDAAWSDPERHGLRARARLPRPERPIVWLGRYECLLRLDHRRREAEVVASDVATARRFAARLEGPGPAPEARAGRLEREDPAAHRLAIAAALEAIAAGEIYQVNLARPFAAPIDGDPLALFAAMREASLVPFGFYLEAGGHAWLARTMERFLAWDPASRSLECRPIKGTLARRGREAAEAAALAADPKERAEHSMIVDLIRNDLGRVAEVGSVEVRDALRVEPFAGLSHLVSTVRARTRMDLGQTGALGAILEATFAPGSVTGAPKLAAMEQIEALERQARGVYTGAVGYVDRAGGLSLAVAIRTAHVARGRATYLAGGGIVSASEIERELDETELKAKVFRDALERLGR